MSYRLEPGEHPGEGARRIAGEQVSRALDELANTIQPTAWKIHQVRKRCKKIRAVARLVRFDLDAYRTTNTLLRDAAREISDTRDARVIYGLCCDLEKGNSFCREGRDPILRWYGMYCELAEEAAEKCLLDLETALSEAGDLIARWDVSGIGDVTLQKGMRKSLDRAHRKRSSALASNRPKAFHAWRKRCKYHWYHLRLLESYLPGDGPVRIKLFDNLGEYLGDAHDRSVLLDSLNGLPGFLREQPPALRRSAAAREERRELRRRAIEESSPVFDEAPDVASDRLASLG